MVLERMGSALAIPPPHASVRQDSLNKQPLGVGVYQSMRKSPFIICSVTLDVQRRLAPNGRLIFPGSLDFILRAGHSFRFWENAIVLENHYAARC